MVSVVQSFFQKLITLSFTTCYGATTLFSLAWRVLTTGPSHVFCVKSRERPPDLDNPQYGTHHYAELKNIRLHYIENGPEDKPLMLMVHGFPEFWYSWRHQLKEFNNDFRVVAMDMRGYSESEKPSGVSLYSIDHLVEDIRRLVHHLGYKNCILLGHDWGGILCYLLATKHPDLVEKLIICNAGHPAAASKSMATSISQLRKFWYTFMYQWPVLPILWLRQGDLQFIEDVLTGGEGGAKPGSVSEQEVEAYKYTFQNYGDLVGPVNFYRALFRYPTTDEGLRGRIRMPTLIIWGTEDIALKRDLAEKSLDYLDKGTLRFIEGGSHWIQQEEPEIVNKHIRDFLLIPGKL